MRLDGQTIARVSGPSDARFDALDARLEDAGGRVVQLDRGAPADQPLDAVIIALAPAPTTGDRTRMDWPDLASASRTLARLGPRLARRGGRALVISATPGPGLRSAALARAFADARRIWLGDLSTLWALEGLRLDHLSLPPAFGESARQREAAFDAVLFLLSDRTTALAAVDARLDASTLRLTHLRPPRPGTPRVRIPSPGLQE